jgi:hypothetical protein
MLTASAVIHAEPVIIFDILADITRHGEIDGSGTLVGDACGPRRLSLGADRRWTTVAMDSHGHRRRDSRGAQLRLGVRQVANPDRVALGLSGVDGASPPPIIGESIGRGQHVRGLRRTQKWATRMRLPNSAHTSRPWRIHELTRDFVVEDVWALPTPGGPDELPRLVSQIASGNFPDGAPLVVRTLWEARWKVGALLGWDGRDAGVGFRVNSLRDRLPNDLRAAPRGPDFAPFSSVYQLEYEWAAEIANRTVHGVMHIGWVPDESGSYRGQMAVLVKPNGLLGIAYMAAIRPFRHLVVYPALMRSIEQRWLTSA